MTATSPRGLPGAGRGRGGRKAKNLGMLDRDDRDWSEACRFCPSLVFLLWACSREVWGLVAAAEVEGRLAYPGQVLQTPKRLSRRDEAVVLLHFICLAPDTSKSKRCCWIFLTQHNTTSNIENRRLSVRRIDNRFERILGRYASRGWSFSTARPRIDATVIIIITPGDRPPREAATIFSGKEKCYLCDDRAYSAGSSMTTATTGGPLVGKSSWSPQP